MSQFSSGYLLYYQTLVIWMKYTNDIAIEITFLLVSLRTSNFVYHQACMRVTK